MPVECARRRDRRLCKVRVARRRGEVDNVRLARVRGERRMTRGVSLRV